MQLFCDIYCVDVLPEHAQDHKNPGAIRQFPQMPAQLLFTIYALHHQDSHKHGKRSIPGLLLICLCSLLPLPL